MVGDFVAVGATDMVGTLLGMTVGSLEGSSEGTNETVGSQEI
jgi:hypothetical protein